MNLSAISVSLGLRKRETSKGRRLSHVQGLGISISDYITVSQEVTEVCNTISLLSKEEIRRIISVIEKGYHYSMD